MLKLIVPQNGIEVARHSRSCPTHTIVSTILYQDTKATPKYALLNGIAIRFIEQNFQSKSKTYANLQSNYDSDIRDHI